MVVKRPAVPIPHRARMCVCVCFFFLIGQTPNDTTLTLGNDLPFYERFTYKVQRFACAGKCLLLRPLDVVCAVQLLWGATHSIAETYSVPWYLSSVYYPWNRTFEIGLFASQW